MDSGKQRFHYLLDQIQADSEIRKRLADGQISEVIVHQNSRIWELTIQFPTILDVNLYEEFHMKLNLAFKDIARVKLNILALQNSIDQQIILDYWPHTLRLLPYPQPVVQRLFCHSAPKLIEGKVHLTVKDDHSYSMVTNKLLSEINSIYKSFGFPHLKMQVDINEHLDNEDQMLKQIAEHEQNIQQQAQKAIEIHQQKKDKQVTKNNQKANSNINLDDGKLRLGNLSYQSDNFFQIVDIDVPLGNVCVEGYVFDTEIKEFKNNVRLLEIKLTDYTSSIVIKKFAKSDQEYELFKKIKKGLWLKVVGNVEEDRYANNSLTIMARSFEEVKPEIRQDLAEEKRVELHAHSTMSTMDATCSADELVKKASQFGQKAIAITDHSGVQAFPDAYQAGEKYGVKVLLGLEANVVDDGIPIAYNTQDIELSNATYVVFDVETTGLSAVYNKIIELSAVKMHNGQVIEEFEEFIDPGHPLSQETTDLTGITDEMVQGSLSEKEVIIKFMEFCQDSILVAHNATFDIGFLNKALVRHSFVEIANPIIDTLELARFLHPEMKSHRLNKLTAKYDIKLEHHHRAIYDAKATGYLYYCLLKKADEDYGIKSHIQFNDFVGQNDAYKQARPFHATIIAKNQNGLKNLFKLVSMSNVNYFYRVPRIPRSKLIELRDGLIIGSACSNGEVFEAAMQKGLEETEKVAKFYDYLEVMPKTVYQHLIDRRDPLIKDQKELEEILKTIIQAGENLDIPVVATGNVHYLEPEDWIYRKILVHSLGGSSILNRQKLPQVHFRTTDEMLEDFSYLGEEKAKEIVINNPQLIVDQCEKVVPIKDKLYTPKIEGADDDIRKLSYGRAHEIYGDTLPEVVEKRLEKELKSIINNGFSVIYLISQKLVAKSLEDGYLVGSRGSVGSSFVATMTGITEVNPLCPHYVCPNCKYSEFYEHGEFGSGYDMPEKECPKCNTVMMSDGQDIPFETFLGFYGDKVPDIDLNFSGDYQPEAHNYTKVLFGEDHVFRAGTIQTVADKTAYGFVKKYEEEEDIHYPRAEEDRLALGVGGAKRTTGQHPGGIIVIPDYMDVYDFTPIQYPADDISAEWRTTHFDFHKIHDNVLKLDILGHDDPTMIRMLQDLSGMDPKKINPTDKDVMKIFSSPEVLGVTEEEIYSKTGTLGIPEFGTNFVRGMLEATKPSTFAELVQISGLSHGTDVWLNNAESLIESGQATLAECIGCRDDIMVFLIHCGLEDGLAFKIMESVRKGKGITEENQKIMREHNVPEWYINSCLKIKYMFPKAHAAAYVLMALRIAYFKVHQPLIYYCAYFSVRAKKFDVESMCRGLESVKNKMKELRDKGKDISKTEEEVYGSLEIANEMLERGFHFKMVDLERSQATDFVIDGDSLLVPFSAIDGLGDTVAKTIAKSREDGTFLSKEDLQTRGKVSSTLIEYMDDLGILQGLPDENQLSLFDEL